MKNQVIIIIVLAAVLLTFGLTKYFSPAPFVPKDNYIINTDEAAVKQLQHRIDSIEDLKTRAENKFNAFQTISNGLVKQNADLKNKIGGRQLIYDTIKYNLPAKIELCDSMIAEYKTVVSRDEEIISTKDSAINEVSSALADCEAQRGLQSQQTAVRVNEMGVYKTEAKKYKRRLIGAKLLIVADVAVNFFLTYKIIFK